MIYADSHSSSLTTSTFVRELEDFSFVSSSTELTSRSGLALSPKRASPWATASAWRTSTDPGSKMLLISCK